MYLPFAGNGMYLAHLKGIIQPGDYLDRDSHRILQNSYFYNEYNAAKLK